MSSLKISSLDKIIFTDSLKNHTDIHSIISLLVEKNYNNTSSRKLTYEYRPYRVVMSSYRSDFSR